jgi:hypothetical protein
MTCGVVTRCAHISVGVVWWAEGGGRKGGRRAHGLLALPCVVWFGGRGARGEGGRARPWAVGAAMCARTPAALARMALDRYAAGMHAQHSALQQCTETNNLCLVVGVTLFGVSRCASHVQLAHLPPSPSSPPRPPTHLLSPAPLLPPCPPPTTTTHTYIHTYTYHPPPSPHTHTTTTTPYHRPRWSSVS